MLHCYIYFVVQNSEMTLSLLLNIFICHSLTRFKYLSLFIFHSQGRQSTLNDGFFFGGGFVKYFWSSNLVYTKGNNIKRLGLVSLFNGISTIESYLMSKSFFLKNSSNAIQPLAGGIRGFIPFPRVFARK